MAIKQTSPKFEASDGREFDTAAAAELHEKLSVAEQEFFAAKNNYQRALAETQLTKDGKPFTFRWSNYYFITPGWTNLPSIIEVYSSPNACRLEEYTFVIRVRNDETGRDSRYPLSELYEDKDKALGALISAQRLWLKERTEEVEERAIRFGIGKEKNNG